MIRPMTKNDFPLTDKEFKDIYAKVPRLTVEILLKNEAKEVFLTKRSIEPCKGQWHLPGGTVWFGEALTDSVKRIASRELGITITELHSVGFVEYPSHYQNGLDSPFGVVFEITKYDGQVTVNDEAEASEWFSELPENTHLDQSDFLVANKHL